MFFDFIRGGQILTHNIEMFKEVMRKLFKFSLIITFIFVCIQFKKDFNLNNVKNTYTYFMAERYVNTDQGDKILKIIINDNNFKNKYLTLSAKNIVKNNTLKNNKIKTLSILTKNISLSIFVYIFSFISFVVIFFIKGYVINKNNYLRGARIIPLKYLNKIVKKYNKQQKKIFKKSSKNYIRKTEKLSGIKIKHCDYKIAGAIYPYGAETIHTIITGASGTGKTVLITDLINQIRTSCLYR